MFSQETQTLLHKSLSDVPLMVCQKTLRHDADDLVAMVFSGLKLAVVADANTEIALGAEVFRALKGRFVSTLIFLEGVPAADQATVDYVRSQASSYDALVAVGSGTINDVCKYAAFMDGKPYLVFPTAASMNGYLSANASITEGGFKKTCKAAMPQAVFCDMGVIVSAPVRLSKSGLGDSLARPTAQADWLLSRLLLGTPYDDTPFHLLAGIEPVLFDDARGIAKGDAKTIEGLVHILLLSGLGMTIAGGSYPASQGEHMIAHAMEMYAAHRVGVAAMCGGKKTLHGEEIGVTALAMAQVQEQLLRHPPALRAPPFPSDRIMALFGSSVAEEAAKTYAKKLAAIPSYKGAVDWEAIAGKIEAVMLPSAKILSILQAAEAPHTPEMLGWPTGDYDIAVTYARFLRDRLTFLDLA